MFDYLDCDPTPTASNGDEVEAGETVLEASGRAREVLRGERTAANLVGHAAGVATRTRRAVRAARTASESVRVAATRKTTPGLRGVEKRAVAAGGGDTHRLTLSGLVMVKDNHIAELGLLDNLPPTAVREAVERVPDGVLTEASGGITVDSLPAYAETGVDVVSMGSLAHSAPSLDVSFRTDGR